MEKRRAAFRTAPVHCCQAFLGTDVHFQAKPRSCCLDAHAIPADAGRALVVHAESAHWNRVTRSCKVSFVYPRIVAISGVSARSCPYTPETCVPVDELSPRLPPRNTDSAHWPIAVPSRGHELASCCQSPRPIQSRIKRRAWKCTLVSCSCERRSCTRRSTRARREMELSA